MKNAKLHVHDYGRQKSFIKSVGKSFRSVCIKNKPNGREVSDVQLVHLEELTLEGKANTSRVSKILNNVKP
jgi:hypothetical protein